MNEPTVDREAHNPRTVRGNPGHKRGRTDQGGQEHHDEYGDRDGSPPEVRAARFPS